MVSIKYVKTKAKLNEKVKIQGKIIKRTRNHIMVEDGTGYIEVNKNLTKSVGTGDEIIIEGVITLDGNGEYINCVKTAKKPRIEQIPVLAFEELFEGDKLEDVSEVITDSLPYLPNQGYQVLLNEDLKIKIEKMMKQDQKRLDKVLRNLHYGDWSMGVRVKKLTGFSQPIFEARLDKGRRVLFRMKSIPLKGGGMKIPSIVIEDIVKHDYITRGAEKILQTKRINQQNYNYWMIGSEDYSVELNSIKDLEKHDITTLLGDILEMKALEEIEDTTGLTNGVKYFRFDDDIRAIWLETQEIKEYLALTEKQQRIVYQKGPVLINGGAGTGKTTVLAHIFQYYSELHKVATQMLYITLTESLRDFIKHIINSMTQSDISKRVVTFDEVCLKLLGSESIFFDKRNKVDVNYYLQWIKNYPEYAKYDEMKIWQEYYGIVKGFCPYYEETIEETRQQSQNNENPKIKYDKGIFSLDEYLKISNKTSLFLPEDREQIYRIIRRYHLFYREEGKWDSLDIAQFILSMIQNSKFLPRSPIDGIICDEVQDFARIQYSVFSKIIDEKKKRNIFLGGDNLQTINSSNFRWEDVKDLLYEEFNYESMNKGLRDVIYMNFNFRATSKLIQIANEFLEQKNELVRDGNLLLLQKGLEDDDVHLLPGFLLETKTDYNQLLEILNNDRYVIPIVFDQDAKERINLENDIVLTIMEIKGLEFPSIFLHNLATDSKLNWRRINNKNAKYLEDNELNIKYVLNKLYVALTRARRKLVIYETDNHAYNFWEKMGSLRKGNLEDIKRIWENLTSNEEYKEQADYFFENEKYAIAADRYMSAGMMKKSNLCRALDKKSKGEYREAVDYFLKIDQREEAAECYLEFDIDQAEAIYSQIQNERGLREVKARRFLDQNEVDKAAQIYLEINDYASAITIYKKNKMPQKVKLVQAKNYEFNREWGKAHKAFKELNRTQSANRCYVMNLFEIENDAENAVLFAEKFKIWDLSSVIYEYLNDDERAIYCKGKHALSKKEFEKADKLFAEIDKIDDRIEIWETQNNEKRIAEVSEDYGIRHLAQNYLERSVNTWIKLGKERRAIRVAKLCPDQNFTVKVLVHLNKIQEAAKLATEIHNFPKAAELWLEMDQIEKAEECIDKTPASILKGDIKQRMEKFDEAAEIFEEIGEITKAMENYLLYDQFEKVLEIYEDQVDKKKYVALFQKACVGMAENYEIEKDFRKAAEYFKRGQEYERSYDNLIILEEWELAGDVIRETDKEKAGVAYQKAELHETAIEMFDEAINDQKRHRIGTAEKINTLKLNKIDSYIQLGENENAANLYLELGEHILAADLFTKIKRYEDAGKAYEKAENYDSAAKQFISAQMPLLAARNYCKAENYKDAYTLYEANIEELDTIDDQTAELYGKTCEQLEKWLQAGDIFYSVKSFRRAGKNYKAANEFDKAIECYTKTEENNDIAIIYDELQDYGKAAQFYKKSRNHEKAAEMFEMAGDVKNAALIHQQLGNHQMAIELLKDTEEFSLIAFSYQKLNEIAKAREYYIKAEKWDLVGNSFFEKYEFDNAMIYYLKSDNWTKCAECCVELERWEEAAEYYLKAVDLKNAATYFEKAKMYEKALDQYKAQGNNEGTLRMYIMMGDYFIAAEFLEKQRNVDKMLKNLQKIRNNEFQKKFNAFMKNYSEIKPQTGPKKNSKNRRKAKKRRRRK